MKRNIKSVSVIERFHKDNAFEELEDYFVIGDDYISIGVPRKAPETLMKNILAAIKAERLGCKSVDYIYKKYSGDWNFKVYENSQEKLIVEIIECVRNEVGNMLLRIQSIDKINTTGLVIARAVLFRLQNSFKAVLLMIRKQYTIEAFNICRLILEQVAWAFHIHLLEEEKILQTKTTDSIGKLKGFYKTVGVFYGDLSKSVHISPELTPGYINIQESFAKVTLCSVNDVLKSLYDILVLTDIFCCTSEFIFKDFFDKFLFISKENDYEINNKRTFKRKIISFGKKLENIGKTYYKES